MIRRLDQVPATLARQGGVADRAGFLEGERGVAPPLGSNPELPSFVSREEGESVSFNAPGGEKTYEILEVRYE